jgi:hypothetical protein
VLTKRVGSTELSRLNKVEPLLKLKLSILHMSSFGARI